MKVEQYDLIFYAMLSVCFTNSNFKNENGTKSHCFCDFQLFVKRGGAKVTVFLWKGYQLQKGWEPMI